jgi:hypothetical protein
VRLLLGGPDGPYAVIVGGEVVFESRVFAAAEIYYAEEVDKHSARHRDVLARERAHFDAEALRSDAFARTAAHVNRKGGKGGRGGV